MRKLVLLLVLCAAALAGEPASAQVSDAERAAARQLFKEGDDLQREGKFPEALDKFQRAQQVFSAPTNQLRIAECQAALGRLVESAESYRAVVRTPLTAASPAAFQAAVDQAKAELSQVEPRVPKITVQIEPASVSGLQLQIDGETVPAALVGEGIPLDPGAHRITGVAPGFSSADQSVVLKERDTRTVTLALTPGAPRGGTAPAQVAPTQRPPPPLPPPVPSGSAPSAQAPVYYVPPPPPRLEVPPPRPEPESHTGVLVGFHLGWTAPAGNIPMADGTSVDATSLSGGGVAYALDGGLRFARRWLVGLTLEHASLGAGNASSPFGSAATISSDTSLFGLLFAVMLNPDRTSAYFELGVANRWYGFSATLGDGSQVRNGYSGGEGTIGLGLWIPAGRYVRLLPKVSLGIGNFSPPNSSSSNPPSGSSNSTLHEFVMLNFAGFYNLDL